MPMVPSLGPGNFDGGRTYPYSGAALILPIRAPYTAPMSVVVCGGSTASGHVGINTCVSISPEVGNPQWTIETMVRLGPHRFG